MLFVPASAFSQSRAPATPPGLWANKFEKRKVFKRIKQGSNFIFILLNG
jgi:hypothetical protein